MSRAMLARFSLYGFLKNQRYHEPFFVLALLEQGLSFLEIGLLIGLREFALNLLEIPSGALADLYGRRHCMVLSFVAYIAALTLLALAPGLSLLCAAMVLYALGDAFRSGTHKAMIFEWLRREGRARDKAEVYGYTRSWSKRGTAVGALVGAVIALLVGTFTAVFWFTLIPYAINLVNLATYPRELDGAPEAGPDARPGALAIVRVTAAGLGAAARQRPLRRLLAESSAFHGSHKLAREYLQPLIELSVLALPLAGVGAVTATTLAGVDDASAAFRGTVVALGLVYFALGLIESAASRRAGALARRLGGPGPTTRWLWRANLVGYALMLAALLAGWPAVAALVFVVQTGALQNLFRPVQLTRFDEHTPPTLQATVLSIESQSRALFVAAFAPIVGLVIDRAAPTGLHGVDLWPLAAIGLVFALLFSTLPQRTATRELDEPSSPA